MEIIEHAEYKWSNEAIQYGFNDTSIMASFYWKDDTAKYSLTNFVIPLNTAFDDRNNLFKGNSLPDAVSTGRNSGGWSRLPAAYQEVEYLQMNGDSYCNTGLTVNRYGLKVKQRIKRTEGSMPFYLLGFTDDSNIFPCCYITNALSHSDIFICEKSDPKSDRSQKAEIQANIGNISMSASAVYDVVVDFENTYISLQFADFEVMKACSIEDGTSTLLVGGHAALESAYDFTAQRIFYDTIDVYQGKDKVSCLIPCYRKADREAGFYDIVRNIFLTNAGSGVGGFTAGPEVYITSAARNVCVFE